MNLFRRSSKKRIKPPDIVLEDYLSLVELFKRTDGKNWTWNTNWCLTSIPASDWFGVVVEGDRIIELKLPVNNLVGDITGWQMPGNLKKLELRSNPELTGDVSGLKFPTYFQELDVSYTNLKGDITNWGHPLPKFLSRFHITKTSLTGDVTDWEIPVYLVGIKLDQTSMYGSLGKWKLPECIRDANFSLTGLEDKARIAGGAKTRAKMRILDYENRVPFRYNPDD